MKIKCIAIIAIGFLICTCSTPYQPKGALGGYSSHKLGDNTYKVVFKGNQHTKAESVYNYLERRCAEITIENGHEYFIVFEDSSYIDETIFEEEPDLDEKIEAHRKDNYLLDRQPEIDTDPRQTLTDQKTKINRTYRDSFVENKSTNVVGVLKIQLFKESRKGYEDQYLSASEILDKYKIE